MGTGRQSYGTAVAYPRGAAQCHLCSPVSTVQILHCRTWPRVIISSRADIWKSPCAETSKVEFPCSHKLVLPHTHKCSPYPAGLALGSCSAWSRGKNQSIPSGNDSTQGIYYHRSIWRCHEATCWSLVQISVTNGKHLCNARPGTPLCPAGKSIPAIFSSLTLSSILAGGQPLWQRQAMLFQSKTLFSKQFSLFF